MISSGFKFDKEPAEEIGLLHTYTQQSLLFKLLRDSCMVPIYGVADVAPNSGAAVPMVAW